MNQIYDAIIVGGGPAGLSAAIYLARAKYSVLVLEKEQIGGQITITSEVVNYPGVLEASGHSLTTNMRKQAENFGAIFQIAEVEKLELDGPKKKVQTNHGDFYAVGIVLATGAHPRQLGFPGEKEFQGHGIAYCATCDGEFFDGCELFVIGGGFAACEEAIFLTQYATKVTMIVREEDFTCAKTIADEVRAHSQIDIVFETEIIEAGGKDMLEYAVFRNNKDGSIWRYDVKENQQFGIFVFAGYVPANDLFKNQLELNSGGYLVTDRQQKTSLDGVYGAGDICEKELRQVVTAVNDGAIAATSLEKYIPQVKSVHQIETVAYQKQSQVVEEISQDNQQFISQDIRAQLKPILDKLTKDIYLVGNLTEDSFSLELKNFINEFSSLNPHIHALYQETVDSPSIQIYNQEKQPLGIAYHLVPGGHEFNSFVLAIYNAASDGQPLKDEIIHQIQSLSAHNIQVFVSLSCTMCPEVVQSAQRLALENKNIQTSIYDLVHHPHYKEQYHIMSVPCMVIDEQNVVFGKKNIEDIMKIIETA
ncbi:FAD-dependent oxidoreductase [Candidatus Stoquefichus massiliensis]|uniref:FAD-dependent oxidoreductase n=1 Tax=Candidatus Stoquefichus massiliensis TaxID=1470350 RepID=UPI0004849D1F|nr:FAD-dependent oxidoreductase [Candidatus Stoquefichus massiliensis]